MRQFLADQIDQLDLTLDQLAMRDRNFDRFALMLVDNVVELMLHQHAQDRHFEVEGRRHYAREPYAHQDALTAALGPYFGAKVKFAKVTGMLTLEAAESIQNLHTFRNTAYHQGRRHEGILHSLALFYFRIACSAVLPAYKPKWWTYGSGDRISHRAVKYLGSGSEHPGHFGAGQDAFQSAWKRLLDVAISMGNDLVADLHADMAATVDRVDGYIDYMNEHDKKGRDYVVIDCQAWASSPFSEEMKAWAAKNGCTEGTVGGYVEWLKSHFPWPIKNDPVPSWRDRLNSLKLEKNEHLALKKYCDFMKQTATLREQLEQGVAALDQHIEEEIDRMRGKINARSAGRARKRN